jgi:ethanolamine utilization microcompartment shell protein EutL
MWVVLTHEEDPPAEVKQPLEWMLLTSVPVAGLADAIERVEWYAVRHVVARTRSWLRANGRGHTSGGPFTSLEPSPCHSNTMLSIAIGSPRPDIGSRTGRSMTLH